MSYHPALAGDDVFFIKTQNIAVVVHPSPARIYECDCMIFLFYVVWDLKVRYMHPNECFFTLAEIFLNMF